MSGGTGVVASGNITSVVVNCAVNTFTVGGTVSGLAGTLVLHNGSEDQTLTTNGLFAFPTPVAAGGSYAVTVTTQPSSPTQVCTVANGSGTIGSANVTSVAVTCTTSTFTVGGTISGLTGTGLVLRNNASAATDLTVPAASTTFTFVPHVASGGSYAVTVQTQPVGQACTVASGSGGVTIANITSVVVTCVTNSFTVGGTISGLTATSTGLVLRNTVAGAGAGTFDVNVAVGATASFTFPAQLTGSMYTVSVQMQPSNPTQNCTVAVGTGTVTNANIATVAITCAINTFSVGGTISGLTATSTGLVLRNTVTGAGAGTFNINVALGAIASFAFPAQLTGSMYAVSVPTQPSNPTQNCTVAAGTGTVAMANINTVVITCTTTSFTVGGTVTNLLGVGLKVQNNGNAATEITVTSGTPTFTFPAQLSGSAYAVTFSAQPTSPTQSCVVTTGVASGTVGAANIALMVTCTTTSFVVSGSVTGLTGAGLKVRNNSNAATEVTVLTGTPTFAFPAQLSGSAYAISVSAQPTGQTCTPTAPPPISGTVGGANVTGITINCVANTNPVCASVQESGTSTASTLTLTCPVSGQVMTVDFANFGTPSGTCPSGPFMANGDSDGGVGNCPETTPTSRSIVDSACNGMSTCTILVATPGFGAGPFSDPCSGTPKTLTVHAICQ